MATFMFHGAINTNVPIALEEAAKIDGCNRWQTFWKIVFPLLTPTIATVAIIDAMAFWNDYLLPITCTYQEEGLNHSIATQVFYGTYSTRHRPGYGSIASCHASYPDSISVPAGITSLKVLQPVLSKDGQHDLKENRLLFNLNLFLLSYPHILSLPPKGAFQQKPVSLGFAWVARRNPCFVPIALFRTRGQKNKRTVP